MTPGDRQRTGGLLRGGGVGRQATAPVARAVLRADGAVRDWAGQLLRFDTAARGLSREGSPYEDTPAAEVVE
jgi:hypothetical protein